MPAAKQVLRTVHDAVFRDRTYVARHGFEEGYRLVGRMPWFQRPLTDPAAIREHDYFAGLSLAGKVAYDVGANEGSHALALRRRTGAAGRVYAFEPEPGAFARLTRVLALNRLSNVAAFAVALSDETGVGRLALPAGEAEAELAATLDPDLQAMLGDAGTGTELEVPMIRLDEWVRLMDLAPPDFMKVNVEGLEVAVLDGAVNTIAAARPTLFVEIHGADARGKTANAAGVLDRLAPLGYRFHHLESGAEVPPDAPHRIAVGHVICEPLELSVEPEGSAGQQALAHGLGPCAEPRGQVLQRGAAEVVGDAEGPAERGRGGGPAQPGGHLPALQPHRHVGGEQHAGHRARVGGPLDAVGPERLARPGGVEDRHGVAAQGRAQAHGVVEPGAAQLLHDGRLAARPHVQRAPRIGAHQDGVEGVLVAVAEGVGPLVAVLAARREAGAGVAPARQQLGLPIGRQRHEARVDVGLTSGRARQRQRALPLGEPAIGVGVLKRHDAPGGGGREQVVEGGDDDHVAVDGRDHPPRIQLQRVGLQ